MRYNEKDGIEVNGRIIITEDIDNEPIFETSCIVMGDIDADTIKANYDLVIIGSITGTRLDVAGSFSCIGDVNIDTISIQGSCMVDGDLNTENGFIGDNLKAKDICVEDLEVKGGISCNNLECNNNTYCEKNVLISEGLMGTGVLSSNMTICGEYSMIEDYTDVFVADTMEHLAGTKSTPEQKKDDIDFQLWKQWGEKKSTSFYISELEKIAADDDKYKSELNAYKKLKMFENSRETPSIKAYIDVLDTLNRKYILIKDSNLFKKVYDKFYSYTYDDISHSTMPVITQKDFAKMLYVLMCRKRIFDSEIRQLLLETLYFWIGIDYEKICSIMEDF